MREHLFPYDSPEDMAFFLRHLKGIEDHLRLFDATPGMLTGGDMPEYLHDRTCGVVGLLECLIEDGVEAAIDCGEELLTIDLLDQLAISIEGLPNRDATVGEVPELPVQPTSREPKKRMRNKVYDDPGPGLRPASEAGTG